MNYNTLINQSIYNCAVDWDLLASNNLEREFYYSINIDPYSGPQWELLLWIHESVYREPVRELFATYEFGIITYRSDMRVAGIQFRLEGDQRSFSLVKFGWRIGLYSKVHAGELGQCHLVRAHRVKPQQQEDEEEAEQENEDSVRGFGDVINAPTRCVSTQNTRRNILYNYSVLYATIMLIGHHFGRCSRFILSLDYPLIGYTGHMPPGYDYRYDTAPDGSG
ncbi:hypothetical protein Tco_0880463 [Tanacetum coccineum]